MLIQHYCQSLSQGSPLSQPRSPAQILISMETEEKGELERVLGDLEQENRYPHTHTHTRMNTHTHIEAHTHTHTHTETHTHRDRRTHIETDAHTWR